MFEQAILQGEIPRMRSFEDGNLSRFGIPPSQYLTVIIRCLALELTSIVYDSWSFVYVGWNDFSSVIFFTLGGRFPKSHLLVLSMPISSLSWMLPLTKISKNSDPDRIFSKFSSGSFAHLECTSDFGSEYTQRFQSFCHS
jgi:hypothetical protein